LLGFFFVGSYTSTINNYPSGSTLEKDLLDALRVPNEISMRRSRLV
jgi:hypothetical protein